MIHPHWLPLLNNYEQILIAFSGGLDSTVLLHFLSQEWNLSQQIKAIHINHGLHPKADMWAAQCLAFCHTQQIACSIEKVTLNGSGNIEEKARIARYDILTHHITRNSCLLTAHHQDDQAETVLLNLMRGAGIPGICAMPESKKLGAGYLYRPLLQVSREILLHYAQQHGLSWIEDPANQNLQFSRNFIRHNVLPMLKSRWDAFKMLTRTSLLAQEAQTNLEDLAIIDYPDVVKKDKTLLLTTILHLSEARIKNVIRFWLKQHLIRPLNGITWQRLYHELIHATLDANPSIPWDNHIVRRYQHTLYLTKNKSVKAPQSMIWNNFPEPLVIPQIGILHMEPTTQEINLEPNQLIEIRFRSGGEKFFWHGQHQSLKKLMQMWQIPPWERSFIPLLYIDNELVNVIGYACNNVKWGSTVFSVVL